MKIIKKFIHTLLSISGLIPENTTLLRGFFWLSSVAWAIFLLPKFARLDYAVLYFAISTLFYIGFIFLVLPQQGLRLKWIAAVGEEQAYLQCEGILAFAFLHNGVSLGFISESSQASGFWGNLPPLVMMSIAAILFLTGFVIKLWSAWLVGIPIYYWKDMFLGKRYLTLWRQDRISFSIIPCMGLGRCRFMPLPYTTILFMASPLVPSTNYWFSFFTSE